MNPSEVQLEIQGIHHSIDAQIRCLAIVLAEFGSLCMLDGVTIVSGESITARMHLYEFDGVTHDPDKPIHFEVRLLP